MVGIVVVSHSKALADEIIRLAFEMKRDDFPLVNGSGIEGKPFGSNPEIIKEAIQKAKTKEGVIIFVDLGSSVLNTQNALTMLEKEGDDISLIKIADAPLVEGVVASVAINTTTTTLEDILIELKEFKNFSKVNN